MKKISLKILIAFTLAFLVSTVMFKEVKSVHAATVQAYNATAVVTTKTDPLNIRQSASESAKVVGSIPKGATVTITGKTPGWYKVTYNKITGFVSATYINIISTPTITNYSATGIVNTSKDPLNVRKHPNDTATVLGTIAKGKKATITGKTTGWYRINFNGQVGFVNSKYLKIEIPETTVPKPVETAPVVTETFNKVSATGTIKQDASAYSNADTSSKVAKTYKKEAEVKILKESATWYIIKNEGSELYIKKTFVDEHKKFKLTKGSKYTILNHWDVAYTAPSLYAKKVKKPHKIGFENADNGPLDVKEASNVNWGFMDGNVSTDGKWIKVDFYGKDYYFYASDFKFKTLREVSERDVKKYKETKDSYFMTNMHVEIMTTKYERALISALLGLSYDKITESAYNKQLSMLQDLAKKKDWKKLAGIIAKKEVKNALKISEYWDLLELGKSRVELYLLATGAESYIPIKYTQLVHGNPAVKVTLPNKGLVKVEAIK